ncbi:hypothetical protein WJ96_07175 [Burkholderia ubonensis]|uniref:Uncharacterized protein n=1 Tax=Burkholderia ubonensis TaxID=101571 RepID=A0AAW3MZ80_9BURK|nr:hypothetical protein [Burkholderia ubonensis]KVP75482.1 hypothetical protein WJ93_08970 [Burkholderia ubonensis]KVP98295.1 hypothetical protein WJ96_07175 [Burkholderia ubonensis]KVZ92993.1 hypothetical protein WL25_18835 [Burkholderia ubonensis]
MRACMQFRTQNVLEHGEAVLAKYQTLMAHARDGRLPDGWRQPKWWTPETAQRLAQAQPPEAIMTNYLRYHDCGKPICRIQDEAGRQHFPNHAAVSAQLWAQIGGHPDEVWLMANDMLLHTGSAEECEAIRGRHLAPALMFAALSEIHANAEMFGGIETDSFKSKAKQLERRTTQLLKA